MTSKEIVNEQAVRDLIYNELIRYWGKTEEEAKELINTYYDGVMRGTRKLRSVIKIGGE